MDSKRMDSKRTVETFLDFYRERIVNAVLAKSAIFGLLPSEERQALVYKFNARMFEPQAPLINGRLTVRPGCELAGPHILIVGTTTSDAP